MNIDRRLAKLEMVHKPPFSARIVMLEPWEIVDPKEREPRVPGERVIVIQLVRAAGDPVG